MDLLTFLTKKVNEDLTRGIRSNYRKDLFKAIIMSYPPNTVITDKELNLLLKFPKVSSGIGLVRDRARDAKEISFTKVAPGSYIYEVLIPPKQYLGEKKTVKEEPREELRKETIMSVDKSYTIKEIEDLAIRFKFYNNADSVANFIIWLQEREEA